MLEFTFVICHFLNRTKLTSTVKQPDTTLPTHQEFMLLSVFFHLILNIYLYSVVAYYPDSVKQFI